MFIQPIQTIYRIGCDNDHFVGQVSGDDPAFKKLMDLRTCGVIVLPAEKCPYCTPGLAPLVAPVKESVLEQAS